MGRRLMWLESYPPEKQKQLRRLHRLNQKYNSKIILRYTYINHFNEEVPAAVEFLTIPVFKNYLVSLPHQAVMIGYPVKAHANPIASCKCFNMTVCLNWKEGDERKEVAFTDVYQFAKFLKANPELAETVHFPLKRI